MKRSKISSEIVTAPPLRSYFLTNKYVSGLNEWSVILYIITIVIVYFLNIFVNSLHIFLKFLIVQNCFSFIFV